MEDARNVSFVALGSFFKSPSFSAMLRQPPVSGHAKISGNHIAKTFSQSYSDNGVQDSPENGAHFVYTSRTKFSNKMFAFSKIEFAATGGSREQKEDSGTSVILFKFWDVTEGSSSLMCSVSRICMHSIVQCSADP